MNHNITTWVFLNPQCGHGKSIKRWENIRSSLQERIGPCTVETVDTPEKLNKHVAEARSRGAQQFIAAGGDGTVHHLLNAVMQLPDREKVCIGAVGLGSSNDSHKPIRKDHIVAGIPFRIDPDTAKAVDIIGVNFRDSSGISQKRYCLNNASVGITAEANALFNKRLPFVKMLQRISVDGAIIATALKTILTYRAIPCLISVDHKAGESYQLTNLGVVKNPHFAGSLRYDTPVSPDDGRAAVNLCYGMSLAETVRALAGLARGHFAGRAKTKTWYAHALRISCDHTFAVEMDGEIVETREAAFSVVPKAIRWCQ